MPFPPLPKEEDLEDPSEEGSPEDYGDDEDDFGAAVREAFPDQEWDDSRLAALMEAIRICSGMHSEGPGLAVMLGEMSKSKKG